MSEGGKDDLLGELTRQQRRHAAVMELLTKMREIFGDDPKLAALIKQENTTGQVLHRCAERLLYGRHD